MKILVEYANKFNNTKADGIILPLKDYSVESIYYYTLEEIKEIKNNYDGEIFIKLNKNLYLDV